MSNIHHDRWHAMTAWLTEPRNPPAAEVVERNVAVPEAPDGHESARRSSVTGRHSASRWTTSRQARRACRGW